MRAWRKLIAAVLVLGGLHVDATAARAQEITGTISLIAFSAMTYQPLTDVQLRFDTDPAIVATTDSTGSATIANVPVGFHTLIASAQYHADTTVSASVEAGGIATTYVYLMPIPVEVSGTVTTNGGAPAPGVQVIASSTFDFARAITDAVGAYQFTARSAGTYRIATIEPAGFTVPWSETREIAGPEPAIIDISLSAAPAGFTGTVLDPAGQPVADASVFVSAQAGCCSGFRTTDASGRFHVGTDSAATAAFVAHPPSTRSDVLSSESQTVVYDGAVDAEFTITLRRKPSVRGRVVADGQPVVGAVVTVDGDPLLSTITDPSGEYAIANLEQGHHHIRVDSPDTAYVGEFYPDSSVVTAAQQLTFEAGEEKTIDITLERSAEITGVVTLADGNPHPNANEAVAATEFGTDTSILSFVPCRLPVDGQPIGRYRLGCLRSDITWQLRSDPLGQNADPQWYPNAETPVAADALIVSPGATTTGVDFSLRPMSPELTMSSTTNLFGPNTTTEVTVNGTGFPSDPRALTVGFFGGGNQRVSVARIVSSTQAVLTVEVGDLYPYGELLSVSLVASRAIGGEALCACPWYLDDGLSPRTGAIEGRVEFYDTFTGENLPAAGLDVYLDGETNARATTDSNGGYRIADIPIGPHHTSVQPVPGYETPAPLVSVVSGLEPEFPTHQFVALPLGVAGRVVDLTGQAIPNVAVTIDGVPHSASDLDGRFTISTIAAGTHTLALTDPSGWFAPRSETFSGARGETVDLGDVVMQRRAVRFNDDPDSALAITLLPSAFTLDTSAATTSTFEQSLDAIGYCGGAHLNAMWISYSPATRESVRLDTTGSSFPAWVSVVTGDLTSYPTEGPCGQGVVDAMLEAGSTYYFVVYGTTEASPASGLAQLSVTRLPDPPQFQVTVDKANLDTRGNVAVTGNYRCTTTDPNGLGFGHFIFDITQGDSETGAAVHGGLDLASLKCDGMKRRWKAVSTTVLYGRLQAGPAQAYVSVIAGNASGGFAGSFDALSDVTLRK